MSEGDCLKCFRCNFCKRLVKYFVFGNPVHDLKCQGCHPSKNLHWCPWQVGISFCSQVCFKICSKSSMLLSFASSPVNMHQPCTQTAGMLVKWFTQCVHCNSKLTLIFPLFVLLHTQNSKSGTHNFVFFISLHFFQIIKMFTINALNDAKDQQEIFLVRDARWQFSSAFTNILFLSCGVTWLEESSSLTKTLVQNQKFVLHNQPSSIQVQRGTYHGYHT